MVIGMMLHDFFGKVSAPVQGAVTYMLPVERL